MGTRTFKPNPKYATKLRVVITLIALAVMALGMLLGLVIALDPYRDVGDFILAVAITGGLDLLWWLPAMVLVEPYYRSLSYEIQDDEVIVRVGIWTHSVKHVPYRTVTNLTVKRDILDRWLFGLGTLNIQTAGMSGTKGAEEKLVGLPNVHEVYDIVGTELRRFRGAMAPTAADTEEEWPSPGAEAQVPAAALNAILAEVRAIREAMESAESG
jgi:membrane protein YdbS with pleckstrin-like domain